MLFLHNFCIFMKKIGFLVKSQIISFFTQGCPWASSSVHNVEFPSSASDILDMKKTKKSTRCTLFISSARSYIARTFCPRAI